MVNIQQYRQLTEQLIKECSRDIFDTYTSLTQLQDHLLDISDQAFEQVSDIIERISSLNDDLRLKRNALLRTIERNMCNILGLVIMDELIKYICEKTSELRKSVRHAEEDALFSSIDYLADVSNRITVLFNKALDEAITANELNEIIDELVNRLSTAKFFEVDHEVKRIFQINISTLQKARKILNESEYLDLVTTYIQRKAKLTKDVIDLNAEYNIIGARDIKMQKVLRKLEESSELLCDREKLLVIHKMLLYSVFDEQIKESRLLNLQSIADKFNLTHKSLLRVTLEYTNQLLDKLLTSLDNSIKTI